VRVLSAFHLRAWAARLGTPSRGRLFCRTFALLAVLFFVQLTSAQTTQPASVYDGQPLKRAKAQTGTAAQTPPASDFDWQRLLLAMGIVLGLIFLLKFVVSRMYPGVSAVKGTRVVRVLSRSPIAPKQQVLLLQVGRRVVVVADSAGQLATVSEITDPDEVASLIGQIENTEIAAPLKPFSRLFSRAREEYEPAPPVSSSEPTPGEPDQEIEQAQSEISGLIDRMRALTRSVRRE
jgi:flagellar biogenesis protein FliO